MKFFVILALLFTTFFSYATHAESYKYRKCNLVREGRSKLGAQDVCAQDLKCERYLPSKPEEFFTITITKFCKLVNGDRCPTKDEDCKGAEEIKPEDLPRMRPLEGRPSEKDCNEKATQSQQGTATIRPLDSNGNPIPANSSGGRQ